MHFLKKIIIGIVLLLIPNIGHIIWANYSYIIDRRPNSEKISEELLYSQYVDTLIFSEDFGKLGDFGIIILFIIFAFNKIYKNGITNFLKNFKLPIIFFILGQFIYFFSWILPMYDYVHD